MTKTKSKKEAKDFIMNHDAFIRRSMARKNVAIEFFEANLPKHILKEVDLNTLKLEKSDFVDTTLGKGIVDLLFSVKWNEELGYISILFEAQSSVDMQMPFRIMKYMLRVCDLHVAQHKKKEFPPIYPLIVYTGTKPYTAPKSFWEMFAKPTLAKKFFTDPFYVLSLRDIKTIDIRKRYHSGIVLFLMQKIWGKDILPSLKEIRQTLQELEIEDLHLVEDVLRYTLDSGESKNHNAVIEFFEKTISEKHKGKIMTIREQIEKRALKQGIEQGIEQVVLNMLASNMEIETISTATKLSVAEIEKLKNKLH